MRIFYHVVGGLLVAFSLGAAEKGRLELSFETREVPAIYFKSPTNPIVFPNSLINSNVPVTVLRWTLDCNWKSATLEYADQLEGPYWRPVPEDQLIVHFSGRDYEALDVRPITGQRFYRLKGKGLPDFHSLAEVSSPATVFDSDVAVDDQYVYFGTAHGEIYRVEKNGNSGPTLLSTLNFSHLAELLYAKTGQPMVHTNVQRVLDATTYANDLAVFGLTLDEENIYFSVNKVIPVTVEFTEEMANLLGFIDPDRRDAYEQLVGLKVTVYVVIPKSGAVFFLPKALAVVSELTGAVFPPIPIAVGIDGAAGIVVDDRYVYWSALGSHVDDERMLELLQQFIITRDFAVLETMLGETVIDAIPLALGVLILGMPPFQDNGKIQRHPKYEAAPGFAQEYAAKYLANPNSFTPDDYMIFLEEETLVGRLKLPSRNLILKGDQLYFGENGGMIPIVSYNGVFGGNTGLRRISKNGGSMETLPLTTNDPLLSAFNLIHDEENFYFGGAPPVVGGLLGMVGLDGYVLL